MWLIEVVEAYWDELEADFQAYYHTDLCQIFAGGLSLRKASVLASQLPGGSRLRARLGGQGAWSDEVAAILVSGWRTQCAVIGAAGGKRANMPKPPEPPRPGWVDEAREREEKRKQKLARVIGRYLEEG